MGFEIGYYICTPQNMESSLIDWQIKRRNENENFSKKTSKNICQLEISFLLLHPLWETTKSERKEIHVRRHIELTAVLTEMLEQRIKSKIIERFKRTDRDWFE